MRAASGYTTVGQLPLGHIVIGMRMIEEKLREVPDFPAPLRDLLFHMILSHHGEMEFGSPKVPMFARKRCCCITWTISIRRWNAFAGWWNGTR